MLKKTTDGINESIMLLTVTCFPISFVLTTIKLISTVYSTLINILTM